MQPPFPLWIRSAAFRADFLEPHPDPGVASSLQYRSERMPLSSRNAIHVALGALEVGGKEGLKSGVFSTFWGPAATCQSYYSSMFASASFAATPLLFQNTTLSVAMGQLSMEAKVTCPFRTISSSPSHFMTGAVGICAADLVSDQSATVLCIAADETMDWLSASLARVNDSHQSRSSYTSAAAVLVSAGRSASSQVAILGCARTDTCDLDAAALACLGLSGDGSALPRLAIAFILGEKEEAVAAALEPVASLQQLRQLGQEVEAFSGDILATVAFVARYVEAMADGADGTRIIVCVRCMDGAYQWVSLGRP